MMKSIVAEKGLEDVNRYLSGNKLSNSKSQWFGVCMISQNFAYTAATVST